MISVELANPRQYKVELLLSETYKKDKSTLSNMPLSKAVKTTRDGIDVVTHYLIPREDIGEIVRRWPEGEFSPAVQRDIRILEKYSVPLDQLPRHDRSEHIFAVEKHGGDLCDCHPEWKEPGEPTPWQVDYSLIDRTRCRTVNNFGTGRGKCFATLERAKFLGTKRLLIVTTANMADDWVEEGRMVFGKEPLVVHGTPTRRKQLLEAYPRAKVVIVSYGLAHEIPMDGTFNQFIFDEGDLLANPETKRWERFKPIIDATWHHPGIGVQVATGTIYGNTAESLWFGFHIVHPYLAGTFQSYKSRHIEEVSFRTDRVRQVDANGYVSYIEKHRADKVITRHKAELRTKSAAAMVQAKGDLGYQSKIKVITCPLYDEQRETFRAIRSSTLVQVRDRELDMRGLKNQFVKLSQCVEGLHGLTDFDISSKLDRAREIIREYNSKGKKVLVFSRFRAGLDLLAKEFADNSVSYNGSMTKTEKRLSRIAFAGLKIGEEDWFKKTAKERNFPFGVNEATNMFMIVSNETARGQNLHKSCHIALFLSISDSSKANTQAFGRTNRYGQKHDTTTIYLQSDTEFEKALFDIYLENYDEGSSLTRPKTKKDELQLLLQAVRKDRFC